MEDPYRIPRGAFWYIDCLLAYKTVLGVLLGRVFGQFTGFVDFLTEILSVQGWCYQTSTRRDQQFDVKIIPIFSAGRERCLLNHFYGF
jgi:hypothetical protein